jgi:hypothetical protein
MTSDITKGNILWCVVTVKEIPQFSNCMKYCYLHILDLKICFHLNYRIWPIVIFLTSAYKMYAIYVFSKELLFLHNIHFLKLHFTLMNKLLYWTVTSEIKCVVYISCLLVQLNFTQNICHLHSMYNFSNVFKYWRKLYKHLSMRKHLKSCNIMNLLMCFIQKLHEHVPCPVHCIDKFC